MLEMQLGRFPYEPLSKYPHLAKREVVIWDRFVQLYRDFGDRADYDITCGKGVDIPEGTPPNWAANYKYLSKWKIDAVVYRGNTAYVVEVRPRAGLSAIGETLSKAIMFQKEHPDFQDVEPVLVTDIERPDVRDLCIEHDIAFYVA